MDKIQKLADWLRASDPEGCDDGWDYKPQAIALLKLASDAGFAVVPKVPTPKMCEAGLFANDNALLMSAGAKEMFDAYTAMIAAGEG